MSRLTSPLSDIPSLYVKADKDFSLCVSDSSSIPENRFVLTPFCNTTDCAKSDSERGIEVRKDREFRVHFAYSCILSYVRYVVVTLDTLFARVYAWNKERHL